MNHGAHKKQVGTKADPSAYTKGARKHQVKFRSTRHSSRRELDKQALG